MENENNESKLYVGNLPWNTTEQELREAFEQFGVVKEVNIITDRDTGRSRGFAFVKMETLEEAKAAQEGMDGKDFGEPARTLKVNFAKPVEKRQY